MPNTVLHLVGGEWNASLVTYHTVGENSNYTSLCFVNATRLTFVFCHTVGFDLH